MGDKDSQQPWIVSLSVPLPGPNKGHSFTFDADGYALFHVYSILQRISLSNLLMLTNIMGRVKDEVRQENYPDPDAAFADVFMALGLAFKEDSIRTFLEGRPQQTEEDVVGFTYELLRARMITRAQAAAIASALLKPSIDKDAWRKKVDRWAVTNGREALGQTKRPPRK